MDRLVLAGHAGGFPLTPGAKELLLSYLNGARAASVADPDGDETVRDVEMSIGDRLRSALDEGMSAVDEATVALILRDVGPVEETDGSSATIGRAPLLCRIQEGKQIAGLCLGLATRTRIRVDWLRTVAVLLGLVTGGGLILVYLVALLFAPPVPTVDDYRRALERSRALRNTHHL